jgi:hypothetical protein
MEFPHKELLNYGVAVFVLVPILGFFLWAGRAVVRSLLAHAETVFDSMGKQQLEFGAYMKELTHTLAGIREAVQAGRQDALASVRDMGDRIEHVTWAAHDKMVSVFRESLTGAATSIRTSNDALVREVRTQMLEERVEELSRPHDVGDGMVRR